MIDPNLLQELGRTLVSGFVMCVVITAVALTAKAWLR